MSENNLMWREAIEQAITSNGGIASLEQMYATISLDRNISHLVDWKATLRGNLYRDVSAGRFARVGLGIYGMAGAKPATAFVKTTNQRKRVSPKATRHADTQGMLLELGSLFAFDTFTADPNADFNGKRLGDIVTLAELPPSSGFKDLAATASNIDVVWVTNGKTTKHPHPEHLFEVENTTDFTNSLQKLYQFRKFHLSMYLVADEKRRSVFESRLDNDLYHEIRDAFTFRNFDEVNKLYQVAAQAFALREEFIIASLR